MTAVAFWKFSETFPTKFVSAAASLSRAGHMHTAAIFLNAHTAVWTLLRLVLLLLEPLKHIARRRTRGFSVVLISTFGAVLFRTAGTLHDSVSHITL